MDYTKTVNEVLDNYGENYVAWRMLQVVDTKHLIEPGRAFIGGCSHFNSITTITPFNEIKGILIQLVETSGRGRKL